MRNLLEKQILADANDGDTTVLFELLSLLSDEQIYGALSCEIQESIKTYYDVHVQHSEGGYSIGVVCPYSMDDEDVIKLAFANGRFEEDDDSNLVDSVEEIDFETWDKHFNF